MYEFSNKSYGVFGEFYEFPGETHEFSDEIHEFSDEAHEFLDENHKFIDEAHESLDEPQEFLDSFMNFPRKRDGEVSPRREKEIFAHHISSESSSPLSKVMSRRCFSRSLVINKGSNQGCQMENFHERMVRIVANRGAKKSPKSSVAQL
ncbi:unnamed protein product [Vicia faba]|uniref:Uncharacterized protein n=1 Tax=Vicia faba TaxID=3906 RepID=A0AAV0ZL94_VICFA|nr:unnamed protein product [Vicia faba]